MGIDKTITVGASSLTLSSGSVDDVTAWFSNTGFCVDLFAPGSNMWTASQDTSENVWGRAQAGSSFAAPVVGGVVSLLYLFYDFEASTQETLISTEDNFETWWKTNVLSDSSWFTNNCHGTNRACSVQATQRHSNMWPGTQKTNLGDANKRLLVPRYRAMMMGVLLMQEHTKFSNNLLRSSEHSFLYSKWGTYFDDAFVVEVLSQAGFQIARATPDARGTAVTTFESPEPNRCSFSRSWPNPGVTPVVAGFLQDYPLNYCKFFEWRKRQMRRIYLPGPDGARPELDCSQATWNSTHSTSFSTFPGTLSWYVNPLCLNGVTGSTPTYDTYTSFGACSGVPNFRLVTVKALNAPAPPPPPDNS